jgi:hypothetical protein
MTRVLIAVTMSLLCTVPSFAQSKEEKPKDKPSDPVEKIDASVDRSITGIIDLVEAKDAETGKITVRSSGPAKGTPYQYIFQVDKGKTKLQDAEGKPLTEGLNSQQLTGAEVRVEFVDERSNSTDPTAPGVHFARKLQIIATKKSDG